MTVGTFWENMVGSTFWEKTIIDSKFCGENMIGSTFLEKPYLAANFRIGMARLVLYPKSLKMLDK